MTSRGQFNYSSSLFFPVQFIIFFALVAACSAAPAQFVFNSPAFTYPMTYTAAVAKPTISYSAPIAVIPSMSAANNVIEPQFSQNIVPTTYTAATSTNFIQGQQFFGGVPGTYVANPAPVAPVVVQPTAISYAAHPNIFTYSAQPHAFTYSAAPFAAVAGIVPLPKTVQQNEGARLITY
jgi:hypothetical protein